MSTDIQILRNQVRIPNLPTGRIVDENGKATDDELTFRQGLLTLLEQLAGTEGLVMPQQTTTKTTLNYVTLCAGDIPTVPAAVNSAQTLQGLQYYYQKSFIPGVVPAQNVGLGNGESYGGATVFPGTQTTVKGPSPYFAVPMRAPSGSYPVITTYNPAGANAYIYDITQSSSFTAINIVNPSNNGFTTNGTSASASAVNQGSSLAINWTADARFGIV